MRHNEIRLTFYAFLLSLPVSYFTIAPAVVSATTYILLLAIDTLRATKSFEAELGRLESEQSLAPLAERLDKMESSLNAVNIRLGMGEFPKGIK